MLFDAEHTFTGKHASYCRALKDDIKLFQTYREAYFYSALLGFLFGRKEAKDTENKNDTASIFPNEMRVSRRKFLELYKFMMLLDTEPNFSSEDYKERAFKDETSGNVEKLKNNMEIFNSYARGGLTILYDKFQYCESKKETVNRLNDFLEEFVEDNNLDAQASS